MIQHNYMEESISMDTFKSYLHEYLQLCDEIDDKSKKLTALRKAKLNRMGAILKHMQKLNKTSLSMEEEGSSLRQAVSKSTTTVKPDRWRLELLKHLEPDVVDNICAEVMQSRRVTEKPTLKRIKPRQVDTDSDVE